MTSLRSARPKAKEGRSRVHHDAPDGENAVAAKPPAYGVNMVDRPQAKLTLSRPNDPAEREAEQVAQRVLQMSDDQAAGQKEHRSYGRDSHSVLDGEHSPSAEANTEIRELNGRGAALPASERAFFEPRFGSNFDQVRVHTDEGSDRAARSIHARAFTLGSDVAFRAGEYRPGSQEGRALLAHELTHVVQQRGEGLASRHQFSTAAQVAQISRAPETEPTYSPVDKKYVKQQVKALYDMGIREHFAITDKLIKEDPKLKLDGFNGANAQHRARYFEIDREMVGPVLRELLAKPELSRNEAEAVALLESGKDLNAATDELWRKKYELDDGTTFADLKAMTDEQRKQKGLPDLSVMGSAWVTIRSDVEHASRASRMTSSLIPSSDLTDVAETGYAESIFGTESSGDHTVVNKNVRGSDYRGKGRGEWALGKYQFMEKTVFGLAPFLESTYKDYIVERDFNNDWSKFLADESMQDALFTAYNNEQAKALFTKLGKATWEEVLDGFPQVSVPKSDTPPAIDFMGTSLQGKTAQYTWENLAKLYPWLQISGGKLTATTSVSGLLASMHLGGPDLTARMLKGKPPAKDNLGTSLFDYLVIHGFQTATKGKGTAAAGGGVIQASEVEETPGEAEPEQYQDATIKWVEELATKIKAAAKARGGPPGAVGGAIADEKDVYGALDCIQDAVIGNLSERALRLDRFLAMESKLLNAFENDLGPGNINLETATELVESGGLEVPGSHKDDIQYSKIVDFLLSDEGTIDAAAAVIAQGKDLFSDVISQLSLEMQEAVLIEHYKQGPSFHDRFRANQQKNPDHLPSPGDDGLQYLANRTRLMAALGL